MDILIFYCQILNYCSSNLMSQFRPDRREPKACHEANFVVAGDASGCPRGDSRFSTDSGSNLDHHTELSYLSSGDYQVDLGAAADLINQCLGYYDYLWIRKKGIRSEGIYDGLPLSFQAEISHTTNSGILEKVRTMTPFPYKDHLSHKAIHIIKIRRSYLYYRNRPTCDNL